MTTRMILASLEPCPSRRASLGWLRRPLIILALALLGAASSACAATREDPMPIDDPEDYGTFAQAMVSRENLSECIEKMDALIAESERAVAHSEAAPVPARAITKNGLTFSLSTPISKEAVIVSFIISRGGLELTFTDATKIAALFGDRMGLTHPIIVTATGQSTFTASWFIKRSKWKAMKTMMLKVRAKNREERDPQQAFATAVLQEIDARRVAQAEHPK